MTSLKSNKTSISISCDTDEKKEIIAQTLHKISELRNMSQTEIILQSLHEFSLKNVDVAMNNNKQENSWYLDENWVSDSELS